MEDGRRNKNNTMASEQLLAEFVARYGGTARAPPPAPAPLTLAPARDDDDGSLDSANDEPQRKRGRRTRARGAPPTAIVPASTGAAASAAAVIRGGAGSAAARGAPLVAIEDVFAAAVLDTRKVDRIGQLLGLLPDDAVCTPESETLMDVLWRLNVQKRLGAAATPAAVAAVDPSGFQTIHAMMTLHPGTTAAATAESAEAEIRMLEKLEVVPRAHEERFLSQRVGTERNCVFGEKCVNMGKGFILREFLTPLEEANVRATNQTNPEHKPCLRCIRACALLQFSSMATNNREFSPRTCAQPHSNIVGIPGEYIAEECMSTSSLLSSPMVIDCADNYTVVTGDGRRWLTQTYRTPAPPAHQPGF